MGPGEVTAARPGLSARRPVLTSLLVAGFVLAATADERTFGLLTDGQVMTRTAHAVAALGELGIAQGHAVNIVRPAGDAVTRYGMGPSLFQVPLVWLAGPLERSAGPGSSQTLFVLGQLLCVLAAAGAAAALARALGASPRASGRAVLATAIASPLWGYVSSDFSEPLQAALVGGAFALAATAAATSPGRRQTLLALAAGTAAGAGLLTKSVFVVLLPFVVPVLWAAADGGRLRRLAAAAGGFLLFAIAWLAFEVVRFGRPFASYQGERFSHPVADGLWRLLAGPNKGLLLYFPLVVLSVLGAVALVRSARLVGLAIAGFCGFVLLTTAAWWAWDGTAGWGPRLLVPLVPLLAALAVLPRLPAIAFRGLFSLGACVNLLGALQPDALTTWYYNVLPSKALTEAEAARYPAFALKREPGAPAGLLPIHHVHATAAFSPIRVGFHLLEARLLARDPVAALRTPPWRTDVPGHEVAVPPQRAIPESALVFFRAGFRWPHLGMSLGRRADQDDTALAYLDCLYDQALRGQDMQRPERAIAFAERLYALAPGPQAAIAYCEGLRIAGQHEALVSYARELPAAWRASAEFGMVLALSARDRADAEKAQRLLGRVIAAEPRPAFVALDGRPASEWPPTLREVLREDRAPPQRPTTFR